MFKIGVGPSSSHTVGPMVAALEFRRLASKKLVELSKVVKSGAGKTPSKTQSKNAAKAQYELTVELFGSLSLTGKGHQTDGAICAGLAGLNPKSSPIDDIWSMQARLDEKPLLDFGGIAVRFCPKDDISWLQWQMDEKPLPHPNTLRFRLKEGEEIVFEEIILSVGGGFIEPVDAKTGERRPAGTPGKVDADTQIPYPYNSAQEYVEQCNK
ncbi:MAG: hypothetical protein KGS72_00005, partial [Cyanobacteria bacterium REEB67]|nr:hypothetical protein [Cyanobacteria bacterium REEB67]